MKKFQIFPLLSMFLFLLFVHPILAISGNNGKALDKKKFQVGIGYDYFNPDIEMTGRTNNPNWVPIANRDYDLEFNYKDETDVEYRVIKLLQERQIWIDYVTIVKDRTETS